MFIKVLRNSHYTASMTVTAGVNNDQLKPIVTNLGPDLDQSAEIEQLLRSLFV